MSVSSWLLLHLFFKINIGAHINLSIRVSRLWHQLCQNLLKSFFNVTSDTVNLKHSVPNSKSALGLFCVEVEISLSVYRLFPQIIHLIYFLYFPVPVCFCPQIFFLIIVQFSALCTAENLTFYRLTSSMSSAKPISPLVIALSLILVHWDGVHSASLSTCSLHSSAFLCHFSPSAN